MDKTHKSTKAINKEKLKQTKLVSSTRKPSTTLSKKPLKQNLNKVSSSPSSKAEVKDAKNSKLLLSQQPHSQVVSSSTTAITSTSKNQKSDITRRAKNIPQKADRPEKKQITSTLIQKRVKPNAVLDTFQNVTVSSPPTTRKNVPGSKNPTVEAPETTSNSSRTRTNTRTLEPEEVVVLRNESAKKRIESEIQAVNKSTHERTGKDSVAFEISFNAEKNISSIAKNSVENRDKAPSDVEASYSDDFESYESDFESESLSASTHSDEDSGNLKQDITTIRADSTENRTTNEEPDDEDSESTQNPITVIHQDKFLEKNFDSGHYDMNLRVQDSAVEVGFVPPHQTFDSLDTFSGTVSEQLDSGISSCRLLPKAIEEKNAVFYGGYADFLLRPVFTQRGVELMSKIKFDTLLFSLLELKPISYDAYMQTYGKLNTTQSFTQSKENFLTSDSQTDDCEMRSKWTQHPPKFDLNTLESQKMYLSSDNCCGQSMENFNDIAVGEDIPCSDIKKFCDPSRVQRSRVINAVSKKSTDFGQLQSFLANSSNLILKVLNRTVDSRLEKTQLVQAHNSHTELGSQLNTNFLSALRVIDVFANSKHNLVITVLESLPEADVYRCDFSNLLIVWSTNDNTKPIRLLSTWSKVCRVEICNDMQDIVVCGLQDGSVAMWDLRETYSFCSKLDGHLTHFAATQSIAPMWNWNESATGSKVSDLGAVIDIKSFLSRRKLECLINPDHHRKTVQFVSLSDSGIIVVWTLVEVVKSGNPFDTSKENAKLRNFEKEITRMEYSSPWARVKLVQSAICDLRTYLEYDILNVPSTFDRAKFLFEKNIYSDEVLREINKTDAFHRSGQMQGLRFACIAAGCDSIYVCTNRNFILICSKSLKPKKFRKVFINESRFLFPTTLKLLTNEDFLAVGLSNGSVMILNCSQKKYSKRLKQADEISMPQSIPPTPQMKEPLNITSETGKSCAIQNMILNERNSFEKYRNPENAGIYQKSTLTSAEPLATKPKLFETRMLDQHLLLSGCMLRKHLVQTLELSSDGLLLFALSDGEVRCYDFCVDRETTLGELVALRTTNSKIINLALAQTSINQQNLILLTSENVVNMHILKR